MTPSPDRCKNQNDEFTPSTRIYRIIQFQRLAEILISRRNSLVHPSKWAADAFEKWRIDKISETCEESKSGVKNYFGQCWTLEPTKNEMWTIYSQGTDGVRIRTTVRKLIAPLSNDGIHCIVAKVKYLKRKKIISYFNDGDPNNDKISLKVNSYFENNSLPDDICAPNGSPEIRERFLKMAERFMIKRLGFSYEHEARLICLDEKGNSDEYFRYRICPNSMIDQIKIHPRVSWREYKALKRTIRKLGFERDIGRSQLHDMRPRKVVRKAD